MATFTLRRFSSTGTLKAIAAKRLLTFLARYRPYIKSRGVVLPKSASGGDLDYDGLANVFMTPDAETPKGLIDALYYIDEMATPEGMDSLMEEARKRGLKVASGSEVTPADVAVQVWLLDKDILERKHAELFAQDSMLKGRTFESFQNSMSQLPKFRRMTDKQLKDLAKELDSWFADKNRGKGCRVLQFERGNGVWYFVRHGEPFKREESIDGVKASSVFYRPLKYDIVIYSPQIGELQINARTKGEKQLYRAKFGKYLLGNENVFPGTQKYTLDPLREVGEISLSLADIEGIEWIKLREVQFYFAGSPWEVVTRKSDDFFALLTARKKPFPDSGRIVKASFQVKFTDAPTPRSVVIKPTNVARYTRDDDGVLVEKWLEARGFILKKEDQSSDEPEKVLAGN